MALGFAAPRISKRVEKHSRIFLLIGTGGLVSLYFGDLLPDVLKLGGASGLAIIIAVWLTYSYLHTHHIKHHEKEEHEHEDGATHVHVHLPQSSKFLMGSMISHCFSSGMLLFVSHELSSRVAASVFLAIIGHKAYEAMSVSILLSRRVKNSRNFILCALFYSLSLPIGVAATALLALVFGADASPAVIRTVALVVASVAVGSLAGCMINDFILPSVRHVRTRKLEAGWVLVGVALTIAFTVGAPG